MNKLFIIILLISIVTLVAFAPASGLKESSTQEAVVQSRDIIANITQSTVNDGIVAKNEVPSMVNTSSDASQVFDGPYFDVTPSAVPITAVGQMFTVTVALHNVTVEDVSAGIGGLEVHLTWNSSLVEPVNVTNDIGVPAIGVLCGQIISVMNGFHDNNSPSNNGWDVLSAPYTGAVEYAVAAASSDPWWSTNSTGTIAVITFQVKSTPTSQSTMCSLQFGHTELCDEKLDDVAHNLVAPWIFDVSNNFANEQLMINAEAQYANYCTLSYNYNYSGEVSDWINETMTKNGNSYNGTIYVPPILGETSVQYRVYAYDSFGRSSKTAISLFETNPVIVNVSDNLQDWCMPESGIVILGVFVQYADHCVLSFIYTNSDGNSSGWINETMAKDGDNYTGAIDCSPIPYHTIVQYRIDAYDSYGHSSETVSWFAKSNGEETGPWILNVSDSSNDGNWNWGDMNINAVVCAANKCVLSWFNGTCWINETMTKNGNDYAGTASSWSDESDGVWEVQVEYKVTAYDGSGRSSETAIVTYYFSSSA